MEEGGGGADRVVKGGGEGGTKGPLKSLKGFLVRCHALVKMVYLVVWIMSERDLTFGLQAGRTRAPPLTTFSHAFEYFEVEEKI